MQRLRRTKQREESDERRRQAEEKKTKKAEDKRRKQGANAKRDNESEQEDGHRSSDDFECANANSSHRQREHANTSNSRPEPEHADASSPPQQAEQAGASTSRQPMTEQDALNLLRRRREHYDRMPAVQHLRKSIWEKSPWQVIKELDQQQLNLEGNEQQIKDRLFRFAMLKIMPNSPYTWSRSCDERPDDALPETTQALNLQASFLDDSIEGGFKTGTLPQTNVPQGTSSRHSSRASISSKDSSVAGSASRQSAKTNANQTTPVSHRSRRTGSLPTDPLHASTAVRDIEVPRDASTIRTQNWIDQSALPALSRKPLTTDDSSMLYNGMQVRFDPWLTQTLTRAAFHSSLSPDFAWFLPGGRGPPVPHDVQQAQHPLEIRAKPPVSMTQEFQMLIKRFEGLQTDLPPDHLYQPTMTQIETHERASRHGSSSRQASVSNVVGDVHQDASNRGSQRSSRHSSRRGTHDLDSQATEDSDVSSIHRRRVTPPPPVHSQPKTPKRQPDIVPIKRRGKEPSPVLKDRHSKTSKKINKARSHSTSSDTSDTGDTSDTTIESVIVSHRSKSSRHTRDKKSKTPSRDHHQSSKVKSKDKHRREKTSSRRSRDSSSSSDSSVEDRKSRRTKSKDRHKKKTSARRSRDSSSSSDSSLEDHRSHKSGSDARKGHSLARLMKLLKEAKLTFSGTGAITPEEFILELEDIVEDSSAEFSEVFKALKVAFSSTPLLWYKSLRNEGRQFSSFRKFKRAFLERFSVVRNDDDIYHELTSRTQGKNESISDYISCCQFIASNMEEKLSESRLTKIITRNLLKQYQEQLPTKPIRRVSTLLEQGRQIEDRLDNISRLAPPPAKDRTRFPSAAYVDKSAAKAKQAASKKEGTSLAAIEEQPKPKGKGKPKVEAAGNTGPIPATVITTAPPVPQRITPVVASTQTGAAPSRPAWPQPPATPVAAAAPGQSAAPGEAKEFRGTCAICNKIGHRGRDCPDRNGRNVCYSCGKLDARTTSCTSPRCVARRPQQGNAVAGELTDPQLPRQ